MSPDEEPGRIDGIVLDEDGTLLHHGRRVPEEDLGLRLPDLVDVPEDTTDIYVYVHGWQTDREKAFGTAGALLRGLLDGHRRAPGRYPHLDPYVPHVVAVHWPSTSAPLPGGYRRIRDRAHAMTSTGHAAHVIGMLLGYLDAGRARPGGPDVLATAGGQYLHGVAHSFGGRMLGEAVTWAADPPEPPVMGRRWPSRHPFTADSLVVFQMAAPPRAFRDHFTALVDGEAPISGPVVVTMSGHDTALSAWHRRIEGCPGSGPPGPRGHRSWRCGR
ncbi:hypothetical protein Asp14428_77160 [Actinoplanes sp. NBRC 14428]|nr:hypothetical protein Asp14428_77160 [Actinoplanes sp. NBRC 14428]